MTVFLGLRGRTQGERYIASMMSSTTYFLPHILGQIFPFHYPPHIIGIIKITLQLTKETINVI